LSSCPETYVSVGQVCISCSSNCYNCIAVTLCSSCRNTSFILNYTCYNPCPVGYYSDTSSASCKICVNYCTACTSATYCISCSPGYYLSNNTCISLCGNSQVSINGICMNCNSNCTACQSSINSCSACASGFLYAPSINACPSSCPTTLYYNPTTQTCITVCPSATYITKNA
jgi:proprotein convertase subtilisin/kexin type 5